jgi:hypothetical protein
MQTRMIHTSSLLCRLLSSHKTLIFDRTCCFGSCIGCNMQFAMCITMYTIMMRNIQCTTCNVMNPNIIDSSPASAHFETYQIIREGLGYDNTIIFVFVINTRLLQFLDSFPSLLEATALARKCSVTAYCCLL